MLDIHSLRIESITYPDILGSSRGIHLCFLSVTVKDVNFVCMHVDWQQAREMQSE